MAQTLEQKRAYMRQYYAKNPEKFREASKKWRDKNPDKAREAVDKYQHTPRGRASHLFNNYRRMDMERGLPQGDLTVEQVEELIQQPCVHCRSGRMGYYWSK